MKYHKALASLNLGGMLCYGLQHITNSGNLVDANDARALAATLKENKTLTSLDVCSMLCYVI